MSIISNTKDEDYNERESKRVRTQDVSWSYFRDLLPVELKYIVHESLDYESLKNLCGVDKYWSQICGTELGKKIMKKKYIEMTNKEFDRALILRNTIAKINGYRILIKDTPGVEHVGIDKDGNVETDVAVMWYLYPKYCVHTVMNGFTKDRMDKLHKVTNPEDVIAIHKTSLQLATRPNLCMSRRDPFLSLERFSSEVRTMVNTLANSNSIHKKIPSEDMENLKNNPMDPSAWKRPSIRNAIKEYFPQVSFEEIMDAIFPGELDQARVKHSIRFK